MEAAEYVQTVCGKISPADVGITLCHEHLFVDYASNFARPAEGSSRCGVGGLSLEELDELWEKPMTHEIAGHVRCYFSQNKDNMVLNDVSLIATEVQKFCKIGGKTIVECSSESIGRNPDALKQISEQSGCHIVMGCGWYLDRVHPKEMETLTVEELAALIEKDLNEGVNGVCAGIIGELGCSTIITANEAKVLQAAARAQRSTSAAISIHPGYGATSPDEILDILEAAGPGLLPDLSRVVMGHVDRGILSEKQLHALARRGCVLEFDQFGWGCSYTHALQYGITYPSDFERCKMIKGLIDAGFGHQIVLAHDIAFKSRLTKFGGDGYDYLLRNCVPYMKQLGVTEEQINVMLVETPKRLLTRTK